jgi:hypothetical protein
MPTSLRQVFDLFYLPNDIVAPGLPSRNLKAERRELLIDFAEHVERAGLAFEIASPGIAGLGIVLPIVYCEIFMDGYAFRRLAGLGKSKQAFAAGESRVSVLLFDLAQQRRQLDGAYRQAYARPSLAPRRFNGSSRVHPGGLFRFGLPVCGYASPKAAVRMSCIRQFKG